jgi:hypothetical protein
MSDPTQPTGPDEPVPTQPFAGDPIPIDFDPDDDELRGWNFVMNYSLTVTQFMNDGDIVVEAYDGSTGPIPMAAAALSPAAAGTPAGAAARADESGRFFSEFTGKIRFTKNGRPKRKKKGKVRVRPDLAPGEYTVTLVAYNPEHREQKQVANIRIII